MKYLIKLFFTLSTVGISMNSSFAEEQKIENTTTYAQAKAKSPAYAQAEAENAAKAKATAYAQAKVAARKSAGKLYSCEYKITYSNLENQKTFSNDKVAKKNLPFIYTKTVNSVYQYEDSPIINPSKNLNIKVDFDLKMDKKAYKIKITPSTSSTSLDKSIQNAFSIARFSTHKGFWWGDTLKFSDEIKLEKTDNCKIRNMYDDELLIWRKKLSS